MIDANFTCAAQLCAFCCALSSVASSLPGSVGLLHAGFIVRPATLYITPKALGNTNLSVAECSKYSLLNEVCSKYVALLQMLRSDVGHGFSISKAGEAPKDFWVAGAWERASLACSSTCLLSRGSEIPSLGPTRRDFDVKTVFRQKMHIHCGLSFFFFPECHSFKEPSGRICLSRMNFLLKVKGWKKNQPTSNHIWLSEGLGAHCQESPGQPALLKEV